MGIAEGIVAIPYEDEYVRYSRVYQFLKYHLWTGYSAYVTCPSAMTDGSARLLQRHIDSQDSSKMVNDVFRQAYIRLTSRDPEIAWTSGQWMTERIGGSDVRNTETSAKLSPNSDPPTPEKASMSIDGSPLGPWLINGFKWFSSATDSNMAILLAKTPDRGISAFFAPMRRTLPQKLEADDSSLVTTELNGIAIQRLKSKLGTKALPTAELSLNDTRAFLLGREGEGVREISTILNITRVHNAVTACGLWGRGLAISRAFALVRSVKGTRLMHMPAHVKTLANNHVEYRASMHSAFFVVALLGVSEQQANTYKDPINDTSSTIVPSDPRSASFLLRVLTPVTKALTAKAAIAGLAECMESLGGVGYLDSSSPLDIGTNIARLYRDANVLSIWEGTTDVMADDTIRVLKGRMGEDVVSGIEEWLGGFIEGPHTESGQSYYDTVKHEWTKWVHKIRTRGSKQLSVTGRQIMEDLGWIVSALLLLEDARRDTDAVAREIAMRWILKRRNPTQTEVDDWEMETERDYEIVFGKKEKSWSKL